MASIASPNPEADHSTFTTCLLHVIELFHCGGFLFDQAGGILSLNTIAANCLVDNGLVVRGKHLVAIDRGSDVRLQGIVAALLNETEITNLQDATLEVNRVNRVPLLLRLVRLDKSIQQALDGAALLLIATDPEIRHAPALDMLRRMFDLTPAEAAVATGIALGKHLEEIAADRGSSIETVRTHSKRVLAKTGIRKQVALATLLARLALLSAS